MELPSNMRKIIAVIPIVHLLLYVTVGLNIPILRQIIVFIYLSFIPGFVLLKILRLKETSVVDTILFSVGLSIAFLMFVGLLVNELFPILGVLQPLSTIPLEITLSLLTLILFVVGYRQDLSENFSSIGRNLIDLKAILTNSTILVLPILLGIIGALYVNQPILLIMIIAIAALYALSVFATRSILSKSYPLLIFAISMALAFSLLLTSRYIIGTDAPLEYYVFRSTTINGYWHFLPVGINPEATVNFNAMLSITILPAIYSALLNINGEIVFKALYPFVFSLVPVVLYRIYSRQIGKSASLLSTLFFISSPLVFYGVEPLGVNRQIVATFFFVLSVFILLDKTISVGKRRILLIVFGAALVVSHYSLTYLYLVCVFSIYIISKIKGDPDRMLNGPMVFLLSVMAFSWYTFSTSPITSLYQFLYLVSSRFSTDISNPVARSSEIFQSHSILTFASMINWALFYTVHFFIVIGILGLLLKAKKMKLDPKYRVLTILSAVILFLCVAVPNIAPALNFSRFYAITMLFLAPCFVLGAETLLGIGKMIWIRAAGKNHYRNVSGQAVTLVICTLLIGYFLSQSGFINCITGAAPQSYSLDYNRIRTSADQRLVINFYSVYILKQEVFGAVWLSAHMEESSAVYADHVSRFVVLTSYGLIPRQQILLLANTTMLEQGSFIYLGKLNVVNGIITTDAEPFNTSELSSFFNENDQVYSNGNSEIWRVIPPG
jgi:uncharacterized membrane protein